MARPARLALTLCLLIALPLAAGAQQAGKVHRIGFLGPGSGERVYREPLRSFQAGLHDLGYVEGRNVVFEYRFAEDHFERLPGLAAELVRDKVDVIVAHATPGTRAAMQTTSTIPVVMVSAGDPVGAGLIASFARPGGNVTGVSNIDVGAAGKRLELLKEMLPKLSRVAVLRNPTNPSGHVQLRTMQAAAQSLRIEIHIFDVQDAKELDGSFRAMTKAGVGALTVIGDPLFLGQQKRIATLALTSRLPSVLARKEYVESGGLMSFGPTLDDQFRLAATYVDISKHVGRVNDESILVDEIAA